MKVTAIGQQSWAIESSCLTTTDFILVDPVLTDWFGTTERQRFRVWPPRRVLLEQMPQVRAIVITNEHLDHFNLRSLLLLPRNIPIIFGAITPACCVDAARRSGFPVTLLATGQKFSVGDLTVRLYQCSPESVPWERCVHHAVIESESSNQSVIIQSDGLLAAELIDDCSGRVIKPPSLFITTNNAQIVPANATGAFDNLLPLDDGENIDSIAIGIFNHVLCTTTDQLGYVPHLAFCGGGYLGSPAKHGPFQFSDAESLKKTFSSLVLDQQVHCPKPGDTGCSKPLQPACQ